MSKTLRYIAFLISMLLLLFVVNFVLVLTNVCPFDSWYAFKIILNGTLFLVIVNICCAIIAQLVPKKFINPYYWGYRVFKNERRFYEFLGIKKWKDKVPELGGFFKHFSKAHFEKNTPEYVYHFIMETIRGEMAHTWAVVFGVLVFFALPTFVLNFAFPLFLINAIINLPPAMIQRYNRPKLCKIYEHLLQKEEEIVYNDDITMLQNNN